MFLIGTDCERAPGEQQVMGLKALVGTGSVVEDKKRLDLFI